MLSPWAHGRLWRWMLGISFTMLWPQVASALTLSLFPQIALEQEHISLRSLGKLYAEEPLKKKLEKIVLDSRLIQSKVENGTLRREALATLINQRVASMSDSLVVIGPALINVRRTTPPVDQAFVRGVLDEVKTALAKDFMEVEIAPEHAEWTLPPQGRGKWEWRRFDNERVTSHFCLWLDRIERDKVRESIPFWVSVKAKRNMPVLTRPVEKGELLDINTLAYEARELHELHGQLAQISSTQEYVVSRKKIPGDILTKEDVHVRPEVVEGEVVTVKSSAGAVAILAQATALEEGSLGKVVKIKLLGSDQVLRAYVVGRAMAEVRGI